MGNLFDENGYMIIPEPKKEKLFTDCCLVVTSGFCHNGHSLLDQRASFSGHPGIHLVLEKEDGTRGDTYLSPVFGDTARVVFGVSLKAGERVKILCPVCNEELPNLKPCDICENGIIKTISLVYPFDFNNAIGVCDIVDCHNSVFLRAGELIKDDQIKT